MIDETLKKIEKIKERLASPAFPDDQSQVEAWESELKRAALISSLKENDAVKIIVKKLANDLVDINVVLLEDRNLSFEDRNRLLDKKEYILWFLGLFDEATANMTSITRAVDETEKHFENK